MAPFKSLLKCTAFILKVKFAKKKKLEEAESYMKIVPSAKEAVAAVSSGQRIFVHGGATTPLDLLRALDERAGQLKNVELIHIHLMGKLPYHKKSFKQSFKVANLFVGPNVREAFDYNRIDYLPCFLSEMPLLFRLKKRP